MVKYLVLKGLAAALLMLSLAACAPQIAEEAPEEDLPPQGEAAEEPTVGESAEAGRVGDYASLVDALRAAGLAVEPQDPIEQAFFPVTAQVVLADGDLVQVFEFETAEAAAEAAATISPEGSSIGTTMVTWIDTPHFYHSGRLIVLHVGNSAEVTAALQSVLGEQIAGG